MNGLDKDMELPNPDPEIENKLRAEAVSRAESRYAKEIGERLKHVRCTLTQKEVAERTGLKVATISHFECGRRTPCAKNLAIICEALHCSSDFILGINQ